MFLVEFHVQRILKLPRLQPSTLSGHSDILLGLDILLLALHGL